MPAAPGRAGTTNAGLPGASPLNPLAGMRWGRYHSPTRDRTVDDVSAYYNTAGSAGDRRTFGRVLHTPRFRWFTSAIPVHHRGQKFGAREAAAKYIRMVTHGNPHVGVQMAVFRMKPFEQKLCGQVPTRREQRDYRRWIAEFARGISASRVALVLQPDMPFVLCLPHHSPIAQRLVAWSARRFDALPHTTVYLDAGASDWLRPAGAARMLERVGVRGVRGFALDLTHYTSDAAQIRYGTRILRGLRRRGIRGKHFLVGSAENGRPINAQRHRLAFRSAAACRSAGQRLCVALGRKPRIARRGPVDGCLWTGRPWLRGIPPRPYDELLGLIRSSPYL